MMTMTAPTPLTLSVGGMTCGHCVRAVEQALATVPGVTVRQVRPGTADVLLAPGVTPDAALAAVTDAGYPARVAESAVRQPLRQSGGCGCCSTGQG